MRILKLVFLLSLLLIFGQSSFANEKLKWPLDCVPNKTCLGKIGYPDIKKTGKAFNCNAPGYRGHQGTDIGAKKGTDVYSAFDGKVLWVFDGKFDNCPSGHPDCKSPGNWFKAGKSKGYRVCTNLGKYCGKGTGSCFWCFDGGNVVVIKHPNNSKVFATRYDHLKKNSIRVRVGDIVKKGQKIAEVGSAGHSTGSHLHFEVWDKGFYKLADPWQGKCGPNTRESLWEKGNIPWQ